MKRCNATLEGISGSFFPFVTIERFIGFAQLKCRNNLRAHLPGPEQSLVFKIES